MSVQVNMCMRAHACVSECGSGVQEWHYESESVNTNLNSMCAPLPLLRGSVKKSPGTCSSCLVSTCGEARLVRVRVRVGAGTMWLHADYTRDSIDGQHNTAIPHQPLSQHRHPSPAIKPTDIEKIGEEFGGQFGRAAPEKCGLARAD